MAKQTAEAQKASMIDNLPGKTGKPLEEWLGILARQGHEKHGDILKFLKGEYGVTHGFANLIAHEFRNRGVDTSPDELVDKQYAGPKAALKPIYDAIIDIVSGFGSEVEIAPKKSYVSLRRNKQFALIQPSTKTRVDVGINLKDTPVTDRLEASGSFNAMVSHRVRLSDVKDVNAELECWLKAAFDKA